MYFTGPHLRVSVPVTTNGLIPKFTSNGQKEINIVFFPLTARKQLEAKNRRLLKGGFPYLVAEIEEVDGNEPVKKTRKLKTQ